jgi:hypothetical protein
LSILQHAYGLDIDYMSLAKIDSGVRSGCRGKARHFGLENSIAEDI